MMKKNFDVKGVKLQTIITSLRESDPGRRSIAGHKAANVLITLAKNPEVTSDGRLLDFNNMLANLSYLFSVLYSEAKATVSVKYSFLQLSLSSPR